MHSLHRTVAEFQRPTQSRICAASNAEERDSDNKEAQAEYSVTDDGRLARKVETDRGSRTEILTNYDARIVSDLLIDDGVDTTHAFELEVKIGQKTYPQFQVPARQFFDMEWPGQYIGAAAIIEAGRGVRDHARAAIQHLSHDICHEHVFTHSGFRKLTTGWAFLHAGGAIGAAGAVTDVRVVLPNELMRYTLPPPPDRDELYYCIYGTLRFLDAAPEAITTPLLAAVFRAPLGGSTFSIHVVGETGQGKTVLSVLALQHYGAGLDASNVPANWSSTENALEALAFYAKDVPLLVDDFNPIGSQFDVQHYHRKADRLIRNQGNSQGRQRLDADSNLKTTKWPRGLILSTGEDTPRGQSLRARMLVLEVQKGTVDWDVVTECQGYAADGVFARTMSGYLCWVAGQYDTLQTRLRKDVDDLRDRARSMTSHKRTPEITANLGAAWRYFLDFAVESGVFMRDESDQAWARAWQALGQAGEGQKQHQSTNDPAVRFLELVASAIGSGNAHVANLEGGEPSQPESWGWRLFTVGAGEYIRDEMRPQGQRVGWTDGEDNLFLEPDAAYKVAQLAGREFGDALTVTPATLRRRLDDRRLLVTTDANRDTLTVRKQVEGQRRAVLHIHVTTFWSPEATT